MAQSGLIRVNDRGINPGWFSGLAPVVRETPVGKYCARFQTEEWMG